MFIDVIISSATDGCCVSCQNATAGYVCSEETECAAQSVCLGNSSTCPEPYYRNIPCNGGTRFCEEGQCTGMSLSLSLCIIIIIYILQGQSVRPLDWRSVSALILINCVKFVVSLMTLRPAHQPLNYQ